VIENRWPQVNGIAAKLVEDSIKNIEDSLKRLFVSIFHWFIATCLTRQYHA